VPTVTVLCTSLKNSSGGRRRRQSKIFTDLSSKTATEDDPVNLVLDQDLKIGDIVIAKAGAQAVGTITHAKKAGMVGKRD
jgi:hypothetical protein